MDEPDHYLIAIEQYLYWREAGLSDRDILALFGMDDTIGAPRAEYVVRVLTTLHRALIHYQPEETRHARAQGPADGTHRPWPR